jgi:hypothetical protein
VDSDCNGVPDTAACQCQDGQTQSCYDGPPGTANQGICHAGQQTCANNQWGPCTGEQTPQPEVCDGTNTDYNCNGIPQDGCLLCHNGQTEPCWTGPDAGLLADGGGIGVCHQGVSTCNNDVWGSCQGQVLPGPELCDGLDNNCNGQVDDSAICPVGQSCLNGVCEPSACSNELSTCGEGFSCVGGACVLANCGSLGSPCPSGQRCTHGACVDPCAGVTCGAGAFCSAGTCVAGGCYDTPCPSGLVCQQGQCVLDPCSTLTCPVGDLCRDGYCVSSCVFVQCDPTQVCDSSGQCVTPPCGGACASGTCLADGGCGPDVCAGVGCALLQHCVNQNGAAVCVPDPCADVTCPEGVCVDGQCQRPTPTSSASGSSGGSGSSGTQGSTGGTHGSTTASSSTSGGTGSSGSQGSSGSGSSGSAAGAATGTGGTTGKPPGGTQGCGCAAGSGLSPAWLTLVGLALGRRRRPMGGARSRMLR